MGIFHKSAETLLAQYLTLEARASGKVRGVPYADLFETKTAIEIELGVVVTQGPPSHKGTFCDPGYDLTWVPPVVPNVTDKEAQFIKVIATDQYMDGDPSGTTWTSSVCETPADKALLGSLVKKGLAHTNGEGCGLTKAGLQVYETDHRCK